MELAIYCLSRAMESFALCAVDWGLVRRRDVPKRIDVLMFSAAAAAIMHCYSDGRGRHRDVFRSKYLNVLDFVFGNTGAPAATPLLLLMITQEAPAGCAQLRARSHFLTASDYAQTNRMRYFREMHMHA